MKIGLVAVEESGDILGANLMAALQKRYPDATFEGIGGKRMIERGFVSLYPLERLSVMGLIEPLKRLFEILNIRKGLKNHFLRTKPAIVIGIDGPDFNLSLERTLKNHGLKTVHYVSPTVWAWRKGRIHTIKKAVDLVLTLFPFETKIYQDNAIPVCFVGHTLADSIPMHSDKTAARLKLGLPADGKIVAILPGSRRQELNFLASPFLQTAAILHQKDPSITFISACANEARQAQLQEIMRLENAPPVKLFQDQATLVMAAADAIILASGTASLQAMLVKRPTIIAYKMKPWVFAIAKRLVKVPFIGLPNLLANKMVMPEYIQSEVKPQEMAEQIMTYLSNPELQQGLTKTYEEIHHLIKQDAGETAANAISQLLKE
ncbi:MAG: lipid-A-disaccharide synthase [Candidatus Berkiella sp.]